MQWQLSLLVKGASCLLYPSARLRLHLIGCSVRFLASICKRYLSGTRTHDIRIDFAVLPIELSVKVTRAGIEPAGDGTCPLLYRLAI